MYQDFVPKNKPKPKLEEKETKLPWHKAEAETDTAFKAFDIFRMIGFSRTLEHVAKKMYGDQWEGQLRHIEKWYEQHDWQERADKFDAFVQQHDEEYIAQQVRSTRVRFAENLPDVGMKVVDSALGDYNVSREQQQAQFRIMDSIGPAKQQPQTNIYNSNTNMNIQAPSMPKEVKKSFDAEDADFEELYENQDGPEKLKAKREQS